ncbi:uncharacterized protein LOC117546295 [Gymnodraco acuticeps]|uniref:Uncharacterized protein LOC117546295 n=1 Tax=Gymnodraco acuticeps TaxID=8218 RepID=A0A6P8U6F9_GYMAC|nr:uncharacterized protein LOC117546295 [Gymnodraco acuticeps]
MQSLITKIATEKLSTYAAVISIFTYTILLNRDLACTCEPQASNCNLYMLLPPVIILLLILLLDSSFQSVCRYYSSHCRCPCGLCCFYAHHFLRAFLVGLLWVAFLFLDGDWYVCCQNDGSEQQATLACKAEKDIKVNEKVLKSELKNTSRFIGGWILLGIVCVAFVLPFCVRLKGCGKEKRCSNKTFLYEKQIIIEEGNVLEKLLSNSAKEKLTEGIKKNICDKDWEGCFGAAGKLLDPPKQEGGETERQAQNPRGPSLHSSWP